MKRLLALFLSLVLMLGAVVPAYATGDGNFDGGGGGMGSGTSTNYWNPGMDGVRISVVNVDSHTAVGNTVDWSNQKPEPKKDLTSSAPVNLEFSHKHCAHEKNTAWFQSQNA